MGTELQFIETMKAFICLVLFAVGATSYDLTNNCPPGWTDGLAYGMGCLLFNFNTTRTWNEAQEFCDRMDSAFLVEIFSTLQQEFLEEKAYEIEGMTGEGRYWWIGATDVGSEGVWWWSHSHRLVDFSVWAKGQPDNHSHNNDFENYGNLHYGCGYKWNDVAYFVKFYTICQKM